VAAERAHGRLHRHHGADIGGRLRVQQRARGQADRLPGRLARRPRPATGADRRGDRGARLRAGRPRRVPGAVFPRPPGRRRGRAPAAPRPRRVRGPDRPVRGAEGGDPPHRRAAQDLGRRGDAGRQPRSAGGAGRAAGTRAEARHGRPARLHRRLPRPPRRRVREGGRAPRARAGRASLHRPRRCADRHRRPDPLVPPHHARDPSARDRDRGQRADHPARRAVVRHDQPAAERARPAGRQRGAARHRRPTAARPQRAALRVQQLPGPPRAVHRLGAARGSAGARLLRAAGLLGDEGGQAAPEPRHPGDAALPPPRGGGRLAGDPDGRRRPGVTGCW
jgi:hypothetical protein